MFSEKENVPDSCCLSDVVGCGRGILRRGPEEAARMIHVNGCFDSVSNIISQNVVTIAGIGVAVSFIQVRPLSID